ncbi:MAG: hypothetical protein AAF357_10775 [Verrucomicrobiota bacterium]
MKRILTAFAAASLFALSSCTPSAPADGTTNQGFYGPSTENTPNYTDQLRSEFRNNW